MGLYKGEGKKSHARVRDKVVESLRERFERKPRLSRTLPFDVVLDTLEFLILSHGNENENENGREAVQQYKARYVQYTRDRYRQHLSGTSFSKSELLIRILKPTG